MKEARMTFWDLMIGIVLLTLVLGIVGVMLAEDKMPFALGIAFGGAVAAVLCFHMYRTLEKTLDMDEDGARKHSYGMTAVRMAIMAAAVLLAIQFSGRVDIIAVVVGILTLKIAAFIQPVVRKSITMKIFDKGR